LQVNPHAYKPQEISNLLWAMATARVAPSAELVEVLSGQAVSKAKDFNPQGINVDKDFNPQGINTPTFLRAQPDVGDGEGGCDRRFGANASDDVGIFDEGERL
jgi:hypothetical protein